MAAGVPRTALVTGGSRGIGRAVVERLGSVGTVVAVHYGHDAAAADRAVAGVRAAGGRAFPVRAELGAPSAVDELARGVEEGLRLHTGATGLDILVNNAGISGGFDVGLLPSTTSVDTMRTVYETNVFGPVAVTNAMLPLLRRAEAARIVNVSSEVGSVALMNDPDGPMWSMAAISYPSSKTALTMITTMYAKELRDTPIKINAANPGYCATDLNHNTGFRAPEQGAEPIVHLATLPADGPSGQLWGYLWGATEGPQYRQLPW